MIDNALPQAKNSWQWDGTSGWAFFDCSKHKRRNIRTDARVSTDTYLKNVQSRLVKKRLGRTKKSRGGSRNSWKGGYTFATFDDIDVNCHRSRHEILYVYSEPNNCCSLGEHAREREKQKKAEKRKGNVSTILRKKLTLFQRTPRIWTAEGE